MKNKEINSSVKTYTFTDPQGAAVAYFCMDLADAHIVKRLKEATNKLMQFDIQKYLTAEGRIEYDKEVTAAISHILGYDAAPTLFSTMSATTLVNGKFFATVVVETIAEGFASAFEDWRSQIEMAIKRTAEGQ